MDLQFIGDRLRLFIVRFYPILFLLFVVGIWKFNLWSYLDYLILAFVVFILRGVTLDFSLVRKFGLGYLFGTKRYTEFHERVIEGDSAWVKNYLERGGDPNFQSADGVPPLYLAIVNGHFETVKVLVEQGADINLTTPKSYADLSPVFVAAWKKQDEIMEFLLEQGAITNIYFSALVGDLEALKKYVNEGGDVNARRSEGQAQYYSLADTLLHVATWRDSVKIVEFLLEQGADVDIRNQSKCTPLHKAAAHGSKNVVQLLIERGANINASSTKGTIPLHFAAGISGDVEMIKILLDNGANIEAREDYGNHTPLHEAIDGNHIEAVKILIAYGADINAKEHFDRTPLGLAIDRRNRKEIIDFLKSCGAK